MIRIHPAFDELLGGGIATGVLTHVYGTPSSGKTNLALMACCEAAKEGIVVYVDAEGGFSTERVKQIAGKDSEKILKNTLLIKPTTFEEQKVSLDKVADITAKGEVKLVVVDSIALLYRLEEERDIREFGRMLAKLLRIARKYEVAVLMLNQVYTDIDSGRITPVGGTINQYWSKIMLETGVGDDGTRFIILRKHMHKQEGVRVDYRITDKGIKLIDYSSVTC
ncbi:MAG: DNA repair and recombination protein RadB [Candidatus Altiarchaeota archaeon]